MSCITQIIIVSQLPRRFLKIKTMKSISKKKKMLIIIVDQIEIKMNMEIPIPEDLMIIGIKPLFFLKIYIIDIYIYIKQYYCILNTKQLLLNCCNIFL